MPIGGGISLDKGGAADRRGDLKVFNTRLLIQQTIFKKNLFFVVCDTVFLIEIV